MKKQTILLITFTMALSLACQAIIPPPKRTGTAISDCVNIVSAMATIQPVEVPKNLMETGTKQGGEFDPNDYFKILTHISMEKGYVLDYAFYSDFLGSAPALYARPIDQKPYASPGDVPAGAKSRDYLQHLAIEDVEQGYFEYVVMSVMANQFYLVWHANYNDLQIVCDKAAANAIVEQTNSRDFGMKFDLQQQAQVRALTNVEPVVKFTDDSAVVEIVAFTKWGGFFRQTYTVSRAFPHKIEMNEENIVKYDCGIMF